MFICLPPRNRCDYSVFPESDLSPGLLSRPYSLFDGILEFFDAAAQSAHQFGDFLASEEQDDYQYDYDDLPVTDCTRDKHGFFF